MKQTEKLLKALANRRRLAILTYLNKHEQATVGSIAHEIGLSFKATSKHLGILRAVDLLGREQVSLSVYYRLVKSPPGIVKSVFSAL